MNALTVLLLIPSVAIGVAVGQYLIMLGFNLQHKRAKCGECGKKFKLRQLTISGPPCDDCLEKINRRVEAGEKGAGIIIGGASGSGLSPDFTEDMIKTYSDPRLQKVLREAFRPRSEKEEWEDEEG